MSMSDVYGNEYFFDAEGYSEPSPASLFGEDAYSAYDSYCGIDTSNFGITAIKC